MDQKRSNGSFILDLFLIMDQKLSTINFLNDCERLVWIVSYLVKELPWVGSAPSTPHLNWGLWLK